MRDVSLLANAVDIAEFFDQLEHFEALIHDLVSSLFFSVNLFNPSDKKINCILIYSLQSRKKRL